MNDLGGHPLGRQLAQMERRMARRDAIITAVYGGLLPAAMALFVLFPFPLSRVGSIVMIVGFGYMVWRARVCAPRRVANLNSNAAGFPQMLTVVERQIEFARSMLYNVPFFVGANLFWMGLPGTGSTLAKAVQDFVFLGGTSLLFAASYAANQQFIRKELAPLRKEILRSLGE